MSDFLVSDKGMSVFYIQKQIGQGLQKEVNFWVSCPILHDLFLVNIGQLVLKSVK